MQFIDCSGQRYGRLQVISLSHYEQDGKAKRSIWNCLCDCGNITKASGKRMRNGTCLSCGCLRREVTAAKNFKHGQAKRKNQSAEYLAWCEIIRRTENPNCEGFKNYGGRGIRMCAEWRSSFDQFLMDMGNRPSASHSIERIDNSRGYKPGNCKWATRHEQSRNKRNNIFFTQKGKTLCLKDWAREKGVKYSTLMARIQRGWEISKAINTP